MEDDMQLCLDFGTAYSKAWATQGPNDDEIPIALGEAAGSEGAEQRWTVPSEIWRENDRLYWGTEAERRRRVAGAPEPEPMKEHITRHEKTKNLDRVNAETGLTGSETLTLWLGYMLRLTESALEGRQGWEIPRRVAMPCLSGAHECMARDALSKATFRAARMSWLYRGQWDGMRIKKAREMAARALKQTRHRDEPEITPAREPAVVREPLAAGAGRFEAVVDEWNASMQTRQSDLIRRLLLIVDAGAGTTDSVLLQTFDAKGELRLAVIDGTQIGIPVGGRELRRVVHSVIKKSDGAKGQSEAEIEEEAERTMRRLWAAGNHSAEDDETRKLVEAKRGYKKALRTLQESLTRCLKNGLMADPVQHHGKRMKTGGERWPIWTVTTGGAGEMSAVRALTRGKVSIGDTIFDLIPVENEATAPWRTQGGMTRDERRGLQVVGRQMAVVRGGAQPTLPDEIGDLRQVIV